MSAGEVGSGRVAARPAGRIRWITAGRPPSAGRSVPADLPQRAPAAVCNPSPQVRRQAGRVAAGPAGRRAAPAAVELFRSVPAAGAGRRAGQAGRRPAGRAPRCASLPEGPVRRERVRAAFLAAAAAATVRGLRVGLESGGGGGGGEEEEGVPGPGLLCGGCRGGRCGGLQRLGRRAMGRSGGRAARVERRDRRAVPPSRRWRGRVVGGLLAGRASCGVKEGLPRMERRGWCEEYRALMRGSRPGRAWLCWYKCLCCSILESAQIHGSPL